MCENLSGNYEKDVDKTLEVLRKVAEFREVTSTEIEKELKKCQTNSKNGDN